VDEFLGGVIDHLFEEAGLSLVHATLDAIPAPVMMTLVFGGLGAWAVSAMIQSRRKGPKP
jgi:hypothetical protein